MVTSSAVFNELAGVFVGIGIGGAAIAVLCALIASIAMMRGSDGVVGGAVAGWIVGTMLSAAAVFAHNWVPVLVSGVALVAALTVGGIVRGILSGRPARPAAALRATVPAKPAKPIAVDSPRQPAFEVPRAAFDAR